MYEFWYDYAKPKFAENPKLFYTDTDSFIVEVKTDDIYKDIAKHSEKIFDCSNYEIDRPLSIGKYKKVIGLMKDEFGGQIMKTLAGLRVKKYSYLKENNDEDKKAKDTKSCVVYKNLD